jgi:hypothetical protein
MAVDPSVVINLAAEYTGNKAFKQADTAVTKLNKSVKGLARTFGLTFGTAAVIAYGKASVKAFIQDDNAARSLGITLKNLGLETGNTSAYVNEMISNLEKQTGVLDDQLRPAMDRLLRATGSVSKATTLLGLALDISAGTGKDLTTVSQGLQKAFLGNNASLGRLGVGLSKAELASSSFEEIQLRLTELFAGQASSAAESYAGQLNKLTIAGNNAKEVIGKGIVQALTESSGSLNAATTDIENYAKAISDLIVDFGRFFRLSNAVPSIFELLTDPVAAINNFNKVADAIDAQIAKQNAASMGKNPVQSGSYLNKTAATTTKTQKDLLKVTAAQLKLAKAKSIFDLQKIQIEAALKGKISEEDRIRLKLMQAIQDENISQIDIYTKALNEVQAKVTMLQATLSEVYSVDVGNPFIAWEIGLDGVKRALIEVNGQSIALTNTIAQNSLAAGLAGGASFAQALSGARYAAQAAAAAGASGATGVMPQVPAGGSGGTAGAGNNTVVQVTVQGSVIAENDLNQAINNALAASGWAGSAIGYSRQAVITAI